MRTINALDLLHLSHADIWNMPDEKFILRFEDGELETTTRRTIFSWYHWEVHRQYEKIPLMTYHHMGQAALGSDTMLDILSHCSRDIHLAYGDSIDREQTWKLYYQVVNDVYNDFSSNLEAYQTSSNILDYLEIFDHPEVQAANAAVRPNQTSITKAYDRIGKAVMTAPELRHNAVALACRSGLLKLNQMIQIPGPRGFMTDADSNIFQHPIVKGYLEGITTIHDAAIESRGAVKALLFTKKPLRQVEYFNRKMQLSTAIVRDLVMNDCGSTEYINLFVSKVVLKGIEGKNYLKEGKLYPVTPESTDIINTTIQMRSPLLCRYRGKNSVCAVCFGQIAYSVPRDTNLGHVSSTEMCQEGSQLVLSVKHYEGSSVVMAMSIDDSDSRYIREGDSAGKVFIQSHLKGKGVYLLMDSVSKPPVEGASGLASLNAQTDISALSIARITSFRDVIFGYDGDGGYANETYVSISLGSRLGSLSRDFLSYIREEGYTITDSGMYKVMLDNWDFDKVAFELPLRHLNMLDYMSEIEVFLRSPSDNKSDGRAGVSKKLIDYTSFDAAVADLYELVSSKLSVNIAHLEVILLSLTRSATDPDDYRIPEFGEPAMFERHSTLMEGRSAGASMAFERQPAIIENVDSYLNTERDYHILDNMIVP